MLKGKYNSIEAMQLHIISQPVKSLLNVEFIINNSGMQIS